MVSLRSFRSWSTGNLSWLYMARLMHSVAYNFWSIFGPIYLVIQFKERIDIFTLFYLAIHVLYLVLLPAIVPHTINGNLKKSVLWAIPVVVLDYSLFLLMPYNVPLFATAIVLVIPFFRILYWPPYHSQVAEFSEKENRGKQVSVIFVLTSFIGIFIPILSGLIVDRWGFQWLLVPSIILWALSYFPLKKLDDVAEYYSWSFTETFRYLFHPHNRRQVITYAAEGINDAGQLYIWPVALWLILNKEMVSLGLLVGAVVFVTAIVRIILASYIDKRSKAKVLKIGTYAESISWFARAFVITPVQVFVVDSIKRIANTTLKTSFDTMMYAKAAESDNYVDEYTVIREMAINMGRIVLLLVMLFSYLYLNEYWIYITFFFIALVVPFLRWQKDGSS